MKSPEVVGCKAWSSALVSAFALLAGCQCGGPAPEVPPVPAPVPAPAEEVPEGPNVLIVLWDTVRADHLSLYGYNKPTTPHLEAFAKEAAVFTRATAPEMWTLPTHASFFTGLPPDTHGAEADNRWLDDHHTTLAELFSAEGYATFAFSSNLIAGSLTNLMQGFDKQFYTYKAPYTKPASEMTRAKLLAGDRSTEISPGFRSEDPDSGWDKAVYKDAAPLIGSEFLRWLDERESKKKPFFAYLNFMEAHTPRVPSQAARERIMTPAQQELALTTDASLFTEMAWMVGKREYSPEQIEAMRGVYDAALVDLDDATHTLIEGLRERGVLDDTVVVILADHGESLGEHRLFEHRYTIYQTLLHVPLVIRYPKVVAPARIDRPVSTMDLFATLLKLTQQEVPAGCERSVDLFAPNRPSVVHSTLRDPYLASLSDVAKAFPELDLSPWKRTYDAVISDGYKLIVGSDGKAELYDVVKDPGETTDLLTVEAKVAEDLQRLVADWEAGLCPYDPSQRTAEESKKVSGRRTAEEREMLELLGYAEGEEAEAEAAPAPAPSKAGKGRPRRP